MTCLVQVVGCCEDPSGFRQTRPFPGENRAGQRTRWLGLTSGSHTDCDWTQGGVGVGTVCVCSVDRLNDASSRATKKRKKLDLDEEEELVSATEAHILYNQRPGLGPVRTWVWVDVARRKLTSYACH